MANVRFSGGPVNAGVAYEKQDSATVGIYPTNIRAGAAYQIGAFTLGALWESMSDLLSAGADRDTLGLTGALTLGNSVVRLQYFETDKLANAATANGASMLALGLDYNFSKQTAVYLMYASVDNDAAGAFKVSGAGSHGDSLAAVTGQKQTGLSAGMIVRF
jgi:predicted porin